MSAGIGGEEEPKVHEVYEVHIVQRYEENINRMICFRLLLNGEDIIDEMEEEGIRRWQIWEVRVNKDVAI